MFDFTVQQFILLFIALMNIATGVYVLTHNFQHTINRTFFIITFGITMWSGGFFLLSSTGIFIFDKAIHYGGLITVLGFFLFAYVFPFEKRLEGNFLLFLLPFFFAAFFIIPFDLLTTDTIVHPNGRLEPTNGPLLPYYLAGLGMYLLASLFLLLQSFRKASGRARLQMKYFFTGIVIFVIAGFTFGGLLPSLGISQLNFIGPISSIVFIGFTAYAIVYHQLMDIRIIIQRSAIFTALLALIVGFYLVLVNVLGILFQQAANITILWAAGLTTIIGIFSVPYIDRYLRKVTDNFLFKNKYDYSEVMHELSEILYRGVDIQTIASNVSEVFKRTLKTRSISISLNAAQKDVVDIRPSPDRMRVVVSFVNKGVSLGEMGLEEKLSNDPYTDEDVQLLKTFAYHATTAIERAKLYQEVKEHSQELEKKVRERTAQIEELQEERNQIMFDISHKLQTPLTIVKGELEFLRNNMSSGQVLDTFEKSITDISEFIRDLLHLAQLDVEKNRFDRKNIDLSATLDLLIEYFDIVARDKGITIVHTIDPSLIIKGDARRIEEALTNLVSNAVKYIPEESAGAKLRKNKIYITLKRIDTNAELLIRDTGMGISDADLPHIFDRFYRASNEEGHGVDGTGLGLAITKKIIEKHRGTITVTSVVGSGTTFVVILPLSSDSVV